MRLINTKTGLFEEFIGSNIPVYAILSHTWGEEEVSFNDMSNPSNRDSEGYRKITKTREVAFDAGYSYVWIDTCCIDKSSSAELTEAINSMYRWYQRAGICYVLLSDLRTSDSLDTALQECRWFKRGWTLQELIAPENILFFDQGWKYIGSKIKLVHSLSHITRISPQVLLYRHAISSMSVAQKMSWAASRETTRIEDKAYCLLGLFNVNMPLLYGEEEKAFRRLQEEIIKSTADLSIFAWKLPPETRNIQNLDARTFCGVLAESPDAFSQSNPLAKLPRQNWRDFSISSIGIKSNISLLSEPISGSRAFRYILPLDCSWDPNILIGVRLRKCGAGLFIREDPWKFVEFTKNIWPKAPAVRYLLTELPEVYQGISSYPSDMNLFIPQSRSHALQIELPITMTNYDALPWSRYDDEDEVFFVDGISTQYSEYDSAVLRLSTALTFKIDQRDTQIELQSMFYALGWSSLDDSQLQCTVVNYKAFSSALNEVQTQISNWDYNRPEFLRQLVYHKIPKSSRALFQIPGTKTIAVVSFEPTRTRDPKICQNEFWRIQFSCKLYETEDAPKIADEPWILDEERLY